MENAGLAVAQEVWLLLGRWPTVRPDTAGPGNNGGDAWWPLATCTTGAPRSRSTC